MNQAQTCPTTAPGTTPMRLGLWPSIALMLLYLSTQVEIGAVALVAVAVWRTATSQVAFTFDALLEQTAGMQDLITKPAFQWLALIALLVAGALTLLTAWLWLGHDQRGLRVLLGLIRPARLPLAVVPMLTLLMLVSTSFVTYWLFGPVSIESQELLFQGPLLGLAATITLSTIVPLVEETLFRGVLYASLLERGGHALAIVVTAVFFAAIHLLAGASAVGPIVQLLLLALYLGGLRAFTGSLWAPLAAHATWNLVASLAYLIGAPAAP
jgi:membrane protease YdiL (CAAX protease family)